MVSRMPWVMVLVEDGDTVSSDNAKYCASVISDGAGMLM